MEPMQETGTAQVAGNADPKEDTLCSMVGEFYNRKMLPIIALTWGWFLVILALAIFSAARFFEADDAKSQIMYAAVFVCCFQLFILIKIFAWQMIHRVSIKRAIRRLETRVAEQP